MFGPIGGFIPGVLPVGAGQWLLADRKARLTWRRWWLVRHCGTVVEAGTPMMPRLVQAMPGGAEEISMNAARHWTPEYVYIRPAYGHGAPDAYEAVRVQAELVAMAARSYVGTPYNFLTYGALSVGPRGLVHLPLTERTLRRWISTRKDMMCSQLVDQALADAGFHVFDDERLPQDVVPAELFRALIDMPGTRYVIPGRHEAWADGSRFMLSELVS